MNVTTTELTKMDLVSLLWSTLSLFTTIVVATETTEDPEGSGEEPELLVEQPKTGASLGQILGKINIFKMINYHLNLISIPLNFHKILGIASLIILVFYIIGISWKLFKIHRGTYVEEEPVFLKYK